MVIPSDMSAVAQPVTEKFLQVAFLSGRLNSELFDEGEEDLIRWLRGGPTRITHRTRGKPGVWGMARRGIPEGPYPRVDPATINPLENPPAPWNN